ncbi:MAG: FAD-dependent oxidoreductase [Bulleidia sp.]
MSQEFEHLFSRGKIGNVTLKNRIFKPAAADFPSEDGYIHEDYLRFYAEEAKGGTGLIFVGILDPVSWEKAGFSAHAKVENDSRIPGLGTLAETVHDNGAKICGQITHFGSHGYPLTRCVSKAGLKYERWLPIMYPEEIANGYPHEEYTIDEIHQMAEMYGDAALRLKTATFDMVEIHGAHRHGMGCFLSPLTNQRTDEYGGSLENRFRFLKECVENIQKKCGKNFPITVRLNGAEFAEDDGHPGQTIEDTIWMAEQLEKMGVAAINISGMLSMAPMQVIDLGTNVAWAAEVKKHVSIPVLVAGSMNTPEFCEETIRDGKADFVGTARASYADPEWPKKAYTGRTREIVPCLRCLECVNLSRLSWHGDLSCTMNPRVGKEQLLPISPAETSRKIAVVGGGPAGLESACILKERGYDVTIYEKRVLGGMVNEASVPPFKQDLRRMLTYYKDRVEDLNIPVIYQEAAAEDLKEYDAVVVATGAHKRTLKISGIDLPHVHNAIDALWTKPKLADQIAVIGGGTVGIECAILAAMNGRKVTVLEVTDTIMRGEDAAIQMVYEQMMAKYQVTVKKQVSISEITKDAVILSDGESIPAGSVLVSVGLSPDLALYDELYAEGKEVYYAGDCEKTGKIFDAIHAGFAVSRTL